MQKINILIKIFLLVILFICNHCISETLSNDTIEIQLSDLRSLGIETECLNEGRGCKITLEDIIKSEIIYGVLLSHDLKERYELKENELKSASIPIIKENNKYILYRSGLFDLEINKNYKIKSYIKIKYNINSKGICLLSFADSAGEE